MWSTSWWPSVPEPRGGRAFTRPARCPHRRLVRDDENRSTASLSRLHWATAAVTAHQIGGPARCVSRWGC